MNCPEVELPTLGISKFRKRKTISSSLVYVLDIIHFNVVVVQ